MDLTVVIPTLNCPLFEQTVASVVRAAESLAGKHVEILGVGLHSSVNLTAPGFRFIQTNGPVNAGTARNLGIRESKGEVLVFIDSDCLADDSWLVEHDRGQSQGHEVLCGGVRIDPVGTYWGDVYNLTMFWEYEHRRPPRDLVAAPTLNLSVSRRAIEAAGLFDESLDRAEDMEWTHRLHLSGSRIRFDPAAVVTHVTLRRNLAPVIRNFALTGAFDHRARKGRAFSPRDALVDRPGFTLPLTPLLALLQTARLAVRAPGLALEKATLLPGVWACKLAWCVGLLRSRLSSSEQAPP